ncbi:putative protein N(5)-glutamine methyltransferase [Myceligenerans cantabricum]
MHEDPELVARLRAAGCVFAEDEAALLSEAARTPPTVDHRSGGTPPGGPIDPDLLERLVAARIGGAPLEQVLGWAELWGRRWTVTPGVFVPRHRSELLVAEALSHLRTQHGTRQTTGARPHTDEAAPDSDTWPADAVVVDLCCGCGALGGSVALDLAGAGVDVELHASDVDPAATECARKNLAGVLAGPGTDSRAGRLTAVVQDGDLDSCLPASLRERADLLLCNAPYVPTGAIALMPREARDHEPRLALDGGADGLGVLRRVIAAAPTWLRPGGALLFETGHDQAEAAATAARDSGLTPRVVSDDALGATAIIAHRPRPAARA